MLQLRRSVCFSLFPVRPLFFITTLWRIDTISLTQANIPRSYPLYPRQIHTWACLMSFRESQSLQEKGQLKSLTSYRTLLDTVYISTAVSCHCPMWILDTCYSERCLPNKPWCFFHILFPPLQMSLATVSIQLMSTCPLRLSTSIFSARNPFLNFLCDLYASP